MRGSRRGHGFFERGTSHRERLRGKGLLPFIRRDKKGGVSGKEKGTRDSKCTHLIKGISGGKSGLKRGRNLEPHE